jgi:nucleotide-binding universal stress UspA family protein
LAQSPLAFADAWKNEDGMGQVRHILLATDLTDRSERALQRATQLCRDGRAERLTLLHVVAAGLPPILSEQQLTGAEAFLAGKLAELASLDVQTPARRIVRTGDPFPTIIGEGIAVKADLILVGAPGKAPYAETIVGTTAERVIRFGECPVLLINRPPQGCYARVLVAFDGSDGAIRSLTAALAIAPDAEFRFVHAWWPPRAAFGESEDRRRSIDQDNDRLKAVISATVQHAVVASQTATPRMSIDMVENNPYVVMSNASHWPDLVVMGTHSKGRLAGTTSIGHLALHLLNESTCDILMSRP